MILLIVLAVKLPFTKQNSNNQDDDFDSLIYVPANGNYIDENYKKLHEINKDDFSISSTGDRESYPIRNAIDGQTNTYWLSNKAETDVFHPSIFINFSCPTPFDGFIYRPAYHEIDNVKHFDGFPSKLKVYAAQSENDPFVLKAIFTGERMDPSDSIQFVLSSPVVCTRLKLEFHGISTASSFHLDEKLASVADLILFKRFEYDLLYHTGVNGIYNDKSYINLHKIVNFNANTNGDRNDSPFSNALDDDDDTRWISEKEQTDSFYPTIYVNFTEQTIFQGLIYSACRHDKKYYDGFPAKLYVYTSLDGDSYKLHTIFTGEQKDAKVQFILSHPVKCSKIKIELHDVGSYYKEGKFAASDCIVFLKNFDYEECNYQKSNNNYKTGSQYADFHKIPDDIISVGTNGDYPGNPIDHALDTDENSNWRSENPESDTFHPSIFVNFTEPTLFEALAYDVTSEKGTSRKYFGFPEKMLIYTASGDEPLTPKYMFKGNPEDPKMLILLPKPIECTRMMFEFYNIREIKDGGKYAEADGFHFYRNFKYEQINYQKVNGNYENPDYANFHKIPDDIISVGTNGDYPGNPIDYALDTNENSYWRSENPESDTFHPSIFVNFTEPTLFEALIYDVTSEKGTPRKYYGFPEKVKLYTSLDNEPLTLKCLFQGDAIDPHMLFLLPNPINCTRMMFEFYYVKEIKKNGGKYAQADGLHFYRSFIGEAEKFEQITPKYNDNAFINSNKVPDEKFTYGCNGEQTDNYPLSNAFIDDENKYWISNTENSNNFKASIYINFTDPVLLEALILHPTYHDEKKKPREFCGFPLRLNVYSSNDDKPFKLTTKFAEFPDSSWNKLQFVFPAPVRCTKLKLEFDQITTNYFSNYEMKASIKRLIFIQQKLVDYSNNNFTDDLEVIYVNNSFYLDEITNSSFAEFYLPKNNDYLFVVNRQFTFINDTFSCKTHKAGAIKSTITPQINIDKCKFISCSVKSDDENGGAINFINCGIACKHSEFTDCKSTTGGKGGGIYLKINATIEEDAIIEKCTFSGCTAYYGGAVFVYSNELSRTVTFKKCSFTSNTVIESNEYSEESSGSALYLMTARSKVLLCKFSKNGGPSSLKIVYYFENEIENRKLKSEDEIKSIFINDCTFDIHSESKSSISFIHKSELNSPIYLNNCVFKGKLSKNAHYIEGSIENNEKLPNFYVNSCQFSSDIKSAINLKYNDSKYSFDQIGKSNFETQKNFKQHKNIIVLSFIMLSAIFVLSTIIVLIIKTQEQSDA